MFQFFRVNDPARLILIFILFVLIRIGQSYYVISDISILGLKWQLLGEWLAKGFKMYAETFDYTAPASATLYKLLHFVFGRSYAIHIILNGLLIIVQAILFNKMLHNNRALNYIGYMPAFLYIMLMITIPDFMVLSPHLISLYFILLTLKVIFNIIEKRAADTSYLVAGIYMGVATLFYFPSFIFLVVFTFPLIFFANIQLRRLGLYFFGFFIIILLTSIYYYLRDDFSVYYRYFFVHSFMLQSDQLLTTKQFWNFLTGMLVVLVILFVGTQGNRAMTIQQQNIKKIMQFMMFGGLITLLWTKERSGLELIFLIPSIAYYWSYYVINLRRKLIKKVMPTLLLLIFCAHGNYFYHLYKEILTSKEGKKIDEKFMLLDYNLDPYKNNEINTPFFDKQITQEVLAGLDYYHDAINIYEVISKINPELIIDEIGIIDKYFYRFPSEEIKYSKIDSISYKQNYINTK